MKKFIFFILFICIFIILFNKYDRIITMKINNDNIYSYYLEDRQIDVLFIGTSRVYRTFSPMEIWDKYGIVSYNRGINAQYYKNTYYLSYEFIKRNKPKLIIVDTTFIETAYKWDTAQAHVKNMQFSLLKIKAYLDIYDNKINNYFNIYTNLDEFHIRWKELKEHDFNQVNYLKGWFKLDRFKTEPQIPPLKNNIYIRWNKLQPDAIEYAKKIVEIAHKNNVKVLFIKPPSNTSKVEDSLDEQFESIAKENNWNFLNYNKLVKEINFNYSTDMMDWSHVNYKGANKVTNHLLQYIIKNYDIQSRKSDKEYQTWHKDFYQYQLFINNEHLSNTHNFNEWVNLIINNNPANQYTIIIATKGNILNNMPPELYNAFKQLNLTKFKTKNNNMKYIAIIDKNKVLFEDISNKSVTYKNRLNGIFNINTTSNNNVSIYISGKSIGKNKVGFNFVVYDKVNKKVVDSMWIAPNKPNKIQR